MSTQLHIGKSAQPAARAAAAEAASAALRGVAEPALAIALSAPGYQGPELAAALSHELGSIPWVGCSAPAVFAGSALMREGLVLGVISSGEAYVGVGVAGPVSRNPVHASAAAVARALDQMPARRPGRSRALLLFVDAAGGNGAEVVRGAVREGGAGVIWAGGGAGSGDLGSAPSALYARGVTYTDSAVAAALDLPGPIGVGMRHGWRPYGPPLMVTRSRGPITCELEYEPAFEIYRRIAGDQGDTVSLESFATFAMTHPLGIPQADGEHVIRDPLSVEPDGALRCVTEVPDGSLVRLMQGTPKALLLAAREAAYLARQKTGMSMGGALVFDCVSRYLMLGEAFGEEIESFVTALGPSTPMMGCLSFGEIGALGSGVPQFHNKTAVVLALPGDGS
ncbi:MAG: FIST signal transduction protein [Myxococcales bacterium]|jgi:hypothetical protein